MNGLVVALDIVADLAIIAAALCLIREVGR